MRRVVFYLIWTVLVMYLIWVLPGLYLYSSDVMFSSEYGGGLSDETINMLKEHLGYDKSFIEGVVDFLTLHWGKSILYGGDDVFALVLKHLVATFYVLVPTYILSFLVGLFIALVDVKMGRKMPFISVSVVHSVPIFLWAFLLYGVLGKYIPSWLGVAVSLFLVEVSSFYLAIRGVLISENAYRYMLYAEAYGIGGFRLYWRGIKPAAAHIIHIFASKIPHVLGGVPFIEIIWSYSGIGYLTYRAIVSGDLPLVRGSVMMVVLLSLIVIGLSYLYRDVRTYAEV